VFLVYCILTGLPAFFGALKASKRAVELGEFDRSCQDMLNRTVFRAVNTLALLLGILLLILVASDLFNGRLLGLKDFLVVLFFLGYCFLAYVTGVLSGLGAALCGKFGFRTGSRPLCILAATIGGPLGGVALVILALVSGQAPRVDPVTGHKEIY
jgi:hypothetical protein